MQESSYANIILFKQDTPFPAGFSVDSDPFLPGWRMLKNLDSYLFARKIAAAHWSFFYLAGDIAGRAFGHDQPGSLRNAVKPLIARQEGQQLNCLEITRIALKNFLGLPFLSLVAHSRHIQESSRLAPMKTFALGTPPLVVPSRTPGTEPSSVEELVS